MKQTILEMSTDGQSLRSEAGGWTIESGHEVVKAMERYSSKIEELHVGRIGAPYERYSLPKTPLHALGLGWRLLVPPTKIEGCDDWEWYFEKITEE